MTFDNLIFFKKKWKSVEKGIGHFFRPIDFWPNNPARYLKTQLKVDLQNSNYFIRTLIVRSISDLGKTANKIGDEGIKSEKKLKYILYWNKAYGSDDYGFCCGQASCIFDSLFCSNFLENFISFENLLRYICENKSIRNSILILRLIPIF